MGRALRNWQLTQRATPKSAMSSFLITAAVCTRNREKSLCRTLDSLISQELRAAFEILVIDNGSSDGTRAMVESYSKHANSIRYFYESKVGIAHARNRAIHEAQGK